jgi:hypothetical protein
MKALLEETLAELSIADVSTVFDRATPADVRLAPFPHIVIENAIDPEFYAQLAASRLTFRSMGGRADASSNLRTACHAFAMLTPDHIDLAWKRFVAAHLQPSITLRVAESFADHWPSHLPSADALRGSSFGTLMVDQSHEIDLLCDARIEAIGPCTGAPWSHRLGHLDTPNRLFSALFYLRDEDDETVGGGLDLFRFKSHPPEELDAFEFPQEILEKVANVPYAANTLVVFPNGPSALHGVEPRGLSDRDRGYLFITAEAADHL